MTRPPRNVHASVLLLLLAACGSTRETALVPDAAAPTVARRAGSSSQAAAQRLDAIEQRPRADAALAARLRTEVGWLADDAREGRRAGTDSARACARWLADQLGSIGVEPAGDPASPGGWFQEFRVPLDARDGGRSVVQLSEESTKSSLPAVPLFCSEGGSAAGEVVWCGFGIDDAERGWDDFAGKDLRGTPGGKIAVIVRGTPDVAPPKTAEEAPSPHGAPSTPADPWGNAGSVFTKVMNAKRHGASGVLLIPKTADEGVLAFDTGHGARAGIPAVTLDFAKSRVVLQRVLAIEKPDLEHPAGASATPPPASRVLFELRADVVREQGSALNVLGRLRGSDSTRCVVIGAHYDHLGRGGTGSLAPGELNAIHNGADDNASGTAAVLEIARALKATARPCDVIVALWSGEELGLLGSEYWTKKPTVPLASVRANLNLDMVGRAGNGKLQVLGAGTSSAFEGWMKEASEKCGLELAVSTSGQALGGSSDHQSFLKNGIPALHLFSGLHADYHKPSDDSDKFEAEGAARVVDLGVELVQRMSSASKLEFIEPVAPKEGAQRQQNGSFRVRLGSIPNYAYDGKGVLIDGASSGTPAERAGLIKGDVLTQIGDVVLESVHDLTYALGRFKPGDVVVVKYTRDGQTHETRVTLVAPAGDVR